MALVFLMVRACTVVYHNLHPLHLNFVNQLSHLQSYYLSFSFYMCSIYELNVIYTFIRENVYSCYFLHVYILFMHVREYLITKIVKITSFDCNAVIEDIYIHQTGNDKQHFLGLFLLCIILLAIASIVQTFVIYLLVNLNKREEERYLRLVQNNQGVNSIQYLTSSAQSVLLMLFNMCMVICCIFINVRQKYDVGTDKIFWWLHVCT